MFFSASNSSAYKQTAHISALAKSPAELLDMIFEEIEISSKTAIALFLQNEDEAARIAITRTIELIQDGLIAYVEPKYEISKSLLATYATWVALLVQANAKSDITPIYQLMKLVSEMRQTFNEIQTTAVTT